MSIICLYILFGVANGDIDLGSDIIRPTFMFVGPGSPVRIIAFSLNFDDILEGQEIGILTIAPSTAFDGFAPRFQSVRIIINDSNSEWDGLQCTHAMS